MRAETRLGLSLLAAAGLLGVAGDVLFHGQPLGLNAFLWTGLFVAALAALLRAARAPLHQGRRFMAAPLLLFTALLAWHSSPLLLAVNLIALAAAVSLGALRRTAPKLGFAGLLDYAGGALAAGCSAAAGILYVVRQDISWRDVRIQRVAAVARGIAIGAPLVLLFGGLFVAADAAFKQLVSAAVPSVPSLPGHVAVAAAVAWLSGGLLRDLLAAREEARVVSAEAVVTPLPRLSLGIVELGIVLGALNVLFAAFVAVQFRYLFGGRGVVLAHEHLTYAQYARHGFFQLVAASALVLPLLLLADWALRRERPRHDWIFRALAATLLALLFVVMASALQRMRLYEREYGLTELRIYATGLILWLAVVFAWFGVTVLRGRRRAFAVGALLAGFAASVAINVVNPDALIARTNLHRPHVDANYLSGLSDDAIPTLLRELPSAPAGARHDLAWMLLSRGTAHGDWRSWNLSRSRAAAALVEHRAELERLARQP